LDVHDRVIRGELGPGGYFRDSIGSSLVGAVREYRANAGLLGNVDHPRGVRRNHEFIDKAVLQHTLDDPGDERLTCQMLKRFVREAGRAETSRNHAQDTHHGS
jgi:hypothetical protein